MYTLAYTPPGGGAPVTKTFVQWGIGLEWKVVFREQEADEMIMTLPASAVAANPFQFKGTCVVADDTGAIIFQGVLITDPRTAEPPRESIELTWAGPWWYLEGLPYEQLYPQSYGQQGQVLTYQYLTHFVLNKSATNGFAFSRAMISAILDFAISKGAPLQYARSGSPNAYFPVLPGGGEAFLGANFPDLPVLPEVVVNISCAQALLRQIEDYDCVMYFDHSTSPPTFNVRQRNNANPALACTPVTRSAPALPTTTNPNPPAVYDVQGFSLRERYDLRVPFVQITYEQTLTVNGASLLTTSVDVYPNPRPAPPNCFYPLAVTIPLPPVTSTTQAQYLQTLAVVGPGANGPAEDLNFWQAVKPELANAAEYPNLSIVPGSSTRVSSLPNVIIDGAHCKWMAGNVQKDSITCTFSYTGRNGHTARKTFQITKTATDINAPDGATFTSIGGSNPGENANSYAGMAQLIYNDLNARCWEGSVPVFNEVWAAPGPEGGIGPGNTLNIANAFPDWSAMNAAVREVEWQFGRGGVRGNVRVGPNKKLTPRMIMDRMKAWRLKFTQLIGFSSQSDGTLLTGQLEYPDETSAQSLTEAPTNYTSMVVGNGPQSVNPGEGAGITVPNLPPDPLPLNTNPGGTTYSGIIQRDVAATTSEAAGVWGRGTLRAVTNAQGFTDLVLEMVMVDVHGSAVQTPWGGVDQNGRPTGQNAGQIVMRLSDALGQNIALMPTRGCDAQGNPLYCICLRSVWSPTPIPGVTYD